MKSVLKKILFIGGLVLGAWFIGFVYFTGEIYSYVQNNQYDVNIPSQSGIAVLSGGRYRIAKGLELLEEGKGKRLLISGVQKGVRLNEIAEREHVHLYDDMPVDLGYQATTTVGNAKEISEWTKKYQFKTVYAVTSFYHIPRSRLELKKEMPDTNIRFVAVNSEYIRPYWWFHWNSFVFLALEYCKFLAVWCQYFRI